MAMEVPEFPSESVSPEPTSEIASPANSDNENGQVEEDLGLASPFLSKIPPQDRPIVGRYIKDWDAGVTKKFQEYSGKLKPYEALGPYKELEQQVNFVKAFRSDPEMVFRLMWEGMNEQYGESFETELARILQLEEAMSNYEQQQPNGNEQFEVNEGPSEEEIFQQNVVQELEELRAWRDQFTESQQDAAEQAQLDNVLQQLHTLHGEFDDDFILLQLSQHGDTQKAIEAWNSMLGQYSSRNGTSRQAPKIMGGQGGVPSGQVDTKQLRDKDRRQMVANMLENLGD